MHVTNKDIKECIDLRACAYTNWYDKFQKLTFDSVCIRLSDEIVNYLLDEIIILPKECYMNEIKCTDVEDEDDDSDDDALVSGTFQSI